MYCTEEIYELYEYLKKSQENLRINKYVSLSLDYEDKTLNIYFDGGRYIRPVLNIKDNNLLITKDIIKYVDELLKSKDVFNGWNNLLDKYRNIISYVDIENSQYIMLASDLNDINNSISNKERKIEYKNNDKINRYGDYRYLKYTHLDFHRWTMLGAVVTVFLSEIIIMPQEILLISHNQNKQ